MSLTEQVLSLPKPDRLSLMGSIWDSLNSDDATEVSPEIMTQLNERREKYRNDPATLKNWENLKSELAAKLDVEA